MEPESMYFDGTKEIISRPLSKKVHNSFTVEFYIKPSHTIRLDNESAEGVGGLFGQRFVIGPGHGERDNEACVGVSVGTNGLIVYEHSSFFLPALLVYPTTLTDWTHIAIVYRDNTPRLYINGKFKRKGFRSPKESVYLSVSIGGYEPYGYYVGFIKHVAVWDAARTQQHITENLNNTLTGDEPQLVGYWTFDDDMTKSHINNHLGSPREVYKRNIKLIFITTGSGFPYPPLEHAIVDALKQTVREVIVITPADNILIRAVQETPDVILYFTHGLNFNPTQLNILGRFGFKTAVWFTDDPYYIDKTKTFIPYCNMVFTTERNCVSIYKLLGCAHVFYVPLAADTTVFRPKAVQPTYQSDVLFIGNAFSHRIRLLDSIADYLAERNVLILGQGWEKLNNYTLLSKNILDTWTSVEEAANYYNGAKIVLNIHRTYDDPGINHNTNKVPALSVNPRTFEILACGAFQLTDFRFDLTNHYSPKEDLVTYHSGKDLVRKLDYYLSHPDERMTIAKRGLQKTLEEHTYLNRIYKLVDKLLIGMSETVRCE